MKILQLAGQRFGRLLVLERVGTQGTHSTWLCQCDCGKTSVVTSGNLKSNSIQSCGCQRLEKCIERSVTHGDTRVGKMAPEYWVWRSIKLRCRNPKNKSYKDYGGRGIDVCEEWFSSYENFIRDMGRRPSNKFSIDRINNDKNYYKENCRWATAKTQANNKRRSKTNLCEDAH